MWDGLERVLWIGGAQWAGRPQWRSCSPCVIPLILYAYDYHDARSHAERSLAEPERFPNRHAFLPRWRTIRTRSGCGPPGGDGGDRPRSFRERFEMVLEDLGSLPPGPPVLAEGWGLRPELVAQVLTSPRQAIFLVPCGFWVERQIERVPRAAGFNPDFAVSDPARAQRNCLARNHLLALDVVETAARLGLRVVTVDGQSGVAAMADLVEAHFRPFLPRWRY